MKRLLNTQYTEFILDHVVRPYQNMIGCEKRIERLMFVDTDDPASFNYSRLVLIYHTNSHWFNVVLERLVCIYEAIDFSFFPNESFAQALQKELIARGVKPIVYFNDSIYAQ